MGTSSRSKRAAKPAQGSDFAAVALGFLSSLYNTACRMTRNEADAEDLVQDTYVAAFRHAGQLRNVAHAKAWLFRILRNRFLSRDRERRARPELVVLESGADPTDSPAVANDLAHVERSLIARLARPAIVEALGRLPEELRTALLLCDVDGFTYEEIAQIMQCPMGTVRSRIARARAKLAKQLAPHAAAMGITKGPQS